MQVAAINSKPTSQSVILKWFIRASTFMGHCSCFGFGEQALPFQS
jgi:hypothetical protein